MGYHGAAHLTLRSRKFALLAMADIATGIGEEQKMGSRIGKKERRARRSRRDNMARGAKEPQHKGGSLGKRIEAGKRRHRTPAVSSAPRLCCANDAARKETTDRMLADLRNARLERSWSNGAWKMQAPTWFLRKYRRHLHHLPDDVRAKLNLR